MTTLAAAVRGAAFAILAAAAACGAGGCGASPAATTGATPPIESAVATPSPTIAGRPTSLPPASPAGSPGGTVSAAPPFQPPVATLGGLSTGPAAGALGTFSWDGLVSDSPWIVGRVAGTAKAGRGLEISLVPAGAPASWRARWAPVTAGQAGTPAAGGDGTTSRIEVTAPPRAGDWSLQLEAGFGEGRSATWYWRVAVVP